MQCLSNLPPKPALWALRDAGAASSYVEQTRTPLANLIFLLPLVLVFEFGALFASSPPIAERELISQRIIRFFFGWIGITGSWVVGALLLAILAVWYHRQRLHPRLSAWTPFAMVLESAILAGPMFVMHTVLLQIGGPTFGLRERVLQTLGAAMYEELVFRLILVGGILALIPAAKQRQIPATRYLVILGTALVFAAAHVQPIGGEPFASGAFLFRLGAGGYLGWIFVTRGIGLSVGAHFLHNLFVLLKSA